MVPIRIYRLAFIVIALGSMPVQAQTFSNTPLGPYVGQNGGSLLPTTPQASDLVEMVRFPGPGNIGIGATLPLSAFASSQDVQDMNGRIEKINLRLSEGVALAAAMTIVPPNPGDSFSVNMSGADFNSQNAGALSFAYRASEQGLVYIGYARSNSQNLGKAGVTFSFR